ncbi:Retrovirus-related Pol polyprotein from transposon 412 [Merluccius polli]|uniref:Gypsy retrotransposon integrase-like protein 1 n=1 Tax=Merluccius polli TaxID=89951 RepID=A0AA47MUT2_MERPO|nr:Retrovirus-related Pol polyprotein from transposon 412 [Merluccius polli]
MQLEHKKLEMEREREHNKWVLGQEVFEREKDRLLEMERLKHTEHEQEQARELERTRLKFEAEGRGSGSADAAQHSDLGGMIKFLPKFNERDPDVFFSLFENVAADQNWSSENKTLQLETVLIGRAQEAFVALSFEERRSYEKCYELVPEVYRQRFRILRKFERQTHSELARELTNVFNRWLTAECVVEFDGLCNLVLLEQFKNILPERIATYLNKHKVKTAAEAAVLADGYVLTHKNQLAYVRDYSQRWFVEMWVLLEGLILCLIAEPIAKVEQTINVIIVGNWAIRKWIVHLCLLVERVALQQLLAKSRMLAIHATHLRNERRANVFQLKAAKTDHEHSNVQDVQRMDDEPKATTMSNYAPFITEGFVSMVGDARTVSVKILRDTGASESFICQSSLPFSSLSDTGSCVLIRGIGLHPFPVPLHRIKLQSGFVNGKVIIAVRPTMPSHTLGGEFSDSPTEHKEVLEKLVGPCPVLIVSMGGVEVPCLLDTGSMVSTVTESYFSEHFSHLSQQDLQDCKWLGLKAANGLDIPYLGYVEMDVQILDRVLQKRGILIVKYPPSGIIQSRKKAIPGILGMNIINDCYHELFEQYGPGLFQSPFVRAALPVWRRALRHCQRIETVVSSSSPFKVRVQGRLPICIAAGTLSMIPVTCPQVPPTQFLLEPLGPLDGCLPEGLLISPAVVHAERGILYAPVTNVGQSEVWLAPRRVIGTIQRSCPPPVVKSVATASAEPDKCLLDFPGVFTACAVTRAMARAQTEKPSDVSKTGAAKVFVPELPAPLSSSEIIKAQKNDQSLEKYFALASGRDKADHGYSIQNGLLVCRWSPHVDTDVADQVLQVVIPVEYRDLVLKTAHGDTSGHFGVRKTYNRVLQHFYWPRIKRDVARYVKACHACQLAGKPNVSVKPAPLQSIQSVGTLFEHLIIDCVGPLPPSKSGNVYLFTVMCQATRYPGAYALRTITTRSVVKSLSQFISIFG